jgi:hypothetical protein
MSTYIRMTWTSVGSLDTCPEIWVHVEPALVDIHAPPPTLNEMTSPNDTAKAAFAVSVVVPTASLTEEMVPIPYLC